MFLLGYLAVAILQGIYIYIYICTYTHIHIYMHVYTYIYACIYILYIIPIYSYCIRNVWFSSFGCATVKLPRLRTVFFRCQAAKDLCKMSSKDGFIYSITCHRVITCIFYGLFLSGLFFLIRTISDWSITTDNYLHNFLVFPYQSDNNGCSYCYLIGCPITYIRW